MMRCKISVQQLKKSFANIRFNLEIKKGVVPDNVSVTLPSVTLVTWSVNQFASKT